MGQLVLGDRLLSEGVPKKQEHLRVVKWRHLTAWATMMPQTLRVEP